MRGECGSKARTDIGRAITITVSIRYSTERRIRAKSEWGGVPGMVQGRRFRLGSFVVAVGHPERFGGAVAKRLLRAMLSIAHSLFKVLRRVPQALQVYRMSGCEGSICTEDDTNSPGDTLIPR